MACTTTCVNFLNGVVIEYDPAAPGNYTLPNGDVEDFGVTPSYLNQSRDSAAKAGIIAVFVISLIIAGLRIAARCNTQKLGFGKDDVVLILTTLFYVAFVGLAIPLLNLGTGRHIEWIVLQGLIDPTIVARQEVWDFVIHLLYTTAMYLCRVSALLFFHRLSGHERRIRRLIGTAAAAITACYLPQMFTIIFHCAPATALWPYDFQVEASRFTCYSWGAIYLANAVLGLVADLTVFVVPGILVHLYKGNWRERVRLGLVLFPGVLVLGVSAARLGLLAKGIFYPDQSWFYGPMLALEGAEIGGLVIALSVPAIKVYVHREVFAPAAARRDSDWLPVVIRRHVTTTVAATTMTTATAEEVKSEVRAESQEVKEEVGSRCA